MIGFFQIHILMNCFIAPVHGSAIARVMRMSRPLLVSCSAIRLPISVFQIDWPHLISVFTHWTPVHSDKLINDHTLLRFYSPFISVQRARVIRQEMGGDQENRIHSRLGINAGRLRVPSKLRFCPDCVLADRNTYSETYWHRVHQLPGIEVCPDHAVHLELSTARWRERDNISVFLSAESAIDVRTPKRLNINNSKRWTLNRYSEGGPMVTKLARSTSNQVSTSQPVLESVIEAWIRLL